MDTSTSSDTSRPALELMNLTTQVYLALRVMIESIRSVHFVRNMVAMWIHQYATYCLKV